MGSKVHNLTLEGKAGSGKPLLFSAHISTSLRIPVPPAEITGERFPRDTRCVAARDLQPCVTDSGLVQLHQHRENETLPVAHSQQAPRQSRGSTRGAPSPRRARGAGHRGDNGQVAGL